MKLFKYTITGRKIYLGTIDDETKVYSRCVTNNQLYEFVREDGTVCVGWFIDKDAFEQNILPVCGHLIIKNVDEHLLYTIKTHAFMQSATLLRDRYVLEKSGWLEETDEAVLKSHKIICEG